MGGRKGGREGGRKGDVGKEEDICEYTHIFRSQHAI